MKLSKIILTATLSVFAFAASAQHQSSSQVVEQSMYKAEGDKIENDKQVQQQRQNEKEAEQKSQAIDKLFNDMDKPKESPEATPTAVPNKE